MVHTGCKQQRLSSIRIILQTRIEDSSCLAGGKHAQPALQEVEQTSYTDVHKMVHTGCKQQRLSNIAMILLPLTEGLSRLAGGKHALPDLLEVGKTFSFCSVCRRAQNGAHWLQTAAPFRSNNHTAKPD